MPLISVPTRAAQNLGCATAELAKRRAKLRVVNRRACPLPGSGALQQGANARLTRPRGPPR